MGVDPATKNPQEERRGQDMTDEQEKNLKELKNIFQRLQKLSNLFILAGYSASPLEIHWIDNIKLQAEELGDLARK